MRLKIVSIIDRGVPNQERLHLSVLAAANLNFYAVFDTTKIDNNTVVAIPRRAYWFTEHVVSPGDHVILYTKAGTESVSRRTDGYSNHFFYWGLRNTIWGDPKSCAVLVEISNWETSVIG